MNRFWARDKYLDEWEVARKHQAMALGYQITTSMFGVLGAIFIIVSLFSDASITLNFEALSGLVFMGLVFMVYIPHIFLLWTVKPAGMAADIDAEEVQASQARFKNILIFSSIVIGVGFIAGFLYGYLGG